MSKRYRDFVAYLVEKQCAKHAAEYVKPAFAGDVEAASRLSCSLENHERGLVAVAMWRAKVPAGAFGAYLSSVWVHDHRWVIEAARNRRTLAYMFRYANFPLPQELPDVVTLWRGTSKLPIAEARAGYSWTNDRDVACWFAMGNAKRDGSPLVLAAEVAKTDIVLFHLERNESEAVLIRPPASVRIDGTPDDWEHGLVRHNAKMDAHKASF